jgi:hypothetical protein
MGTLSHCLDQRKSTFERQAIVASSLNLTAMVHEMGISNFGRAIACLTFSS